MKLKLVVVDLELTRRQKRLGALGLATAAALATSVAMAVPVQFSANTPLKAADLNTNFADLEERLAALEAAPEPTPVWETYTPTITSDGSAASRLVRGVGGTIRYFRTGKTVCLQGTVVFGVLFSGSGGTFVKVSLPPGLPGATAVASQVGIGTVVRTGDASTLFDHGVGAIESDKNNIILLKGQTGYYNNGDARPGAGFNWTASGCYETN